MEGVAVFDMAGAAPLLKPKGRSQVAQGLFESATLKVFCSVWAPFLFTHSVEEGGDEGSSDVFVVDFVEPGIVVEGQGFEVGRPSSDGAVARLQVLFDLLVKDSCRSCLMLRGQQDKCASSGECERCSECGCER